ncbi:hypothetical protein TNCV_1377581 [Trichonephila clavipes]|nr:hypothetical protein TNCV_1377581 [Trichonephila clavipes]
MIVQFRNEKVSNHGSIPITIDCNVVAFIVFEEGFHQLIKHTKHGSESLRKVRWGLDKNIWGKGDRGLTTLENPHSHITSSKKNVTPEFFRRTEKRFIPGGYLKDKKLSEFRLPRLQLRSAHMQFVHRCSRNSVYNRTRSFLCLFGIE